MKKRITAIETEAIKNFAAPRKPSDVEIRTHVDSTLRKAYGVLICGRLVFESMTTDECVAFRDGHGLGTIIELSVVYGESEATKALAGTSEGERDKFKHVSSVFDVVNPLGKRLEEMWEPALRSIDDALDSEFYVQANDGRPTYDEDHKHKPCTDEECYFAELLPVDMGSMKFDLRKSLPQQISKALRKRARQYVSLADKFMKRVRRGEVELRKVLGYTVVQDGKPICPTVKECVADLVATHVDGSETEVVPVFEAATIE